MILDIILLTYCYSYIFFAEGSVEVFCPLKNQVILFYYQGGFFVVVVVVIFIVFRHGLALVAQAGVQWHDLSSQQPPSPGSSNSPAPASQVAGTTAYATMLGYFFFFLSRDGISLCWRGWS